MSWFGQQRYGMFVHSNIATVPAFAPVHEYADWYWAFLEEKPDIVLHPTTPLPEVQAFHREHYGTQPFDGFIPDLTYARFDADWYAQLLDDAGMQYCVLVTKHHDGFCWWDTQFTDRNSVKLGPKRDITRELADAVRAKGHTFGAYYSLLDWHHAEYPDAERYVDAFMRPQINELLEKYQPALLWGDGHWGHPGGHWRADQIVADARAYADAHGFEVVLNDRFFASDPDFVTFEYDVPAVPPDRPWELCRGLGYSFCDNRTEQVEDFLTAREIVAMLVETVAKGGNLLLNVGPHADGTLAEIQERILRESGEWIRAHADAIHGSTRFDVPGDGAHWYTRTGEVVHAFDLSSAPEPRFGGLAGVTRVEADGIDIPFVQRDDGLHIDARAVQRHPFGTRYSLFGVVSCTNRSRIDTKTGIGARLAAAQAGDVVEIGAGYYADEAFPLTVPAGVTLRGAGATTVIDGGGTHPVILNEGAALENLTVTGAAPGYMMIPPTSVTASGDAIRIDGCHVESIMLSGGNNHVVTNNVIAGGKVWCIGANNVTVRGNYQHGLRWGAGVEMMGGAGHVITENEIVDDLCAIKCASTTDVEIARNRYETRWFGIHLLDAKKTKLYRNRAEHTMRAVTVEGGADNTIEKHHAERCDSGVVIEGGAENTVVTDSWFHDCRVGFYVWGAGTVELGGNAVSDPRERTAIADRAIECDGDVLVVS
jgi:alpha-L-fucosidase